MKHTYYMAGLTICMNVASASTGTVESDKYYLEMNGMVKQFLYHDRVIENYVDSATVAIIDETTKVAAFSYSGKSGECRFRIPLNKHFTIQVSKKGYITKILNVDTRVPSGKRSSYSLLFDVYLFEEIKDIDVSELNNPIANVTFYGPSNDFDYNRRYTDMVNEKLKSQYTRYYYRAKMKPDRKPTTTVAVMTDSAKTIINHMESLPVEVPQPDVIFQIQLIALSESHPLNSSLFHGCGKVTEIFEDGLYKYTVGEFGDLMPAQSLQFEIIRMGFRDAFIIAVKDGQRIPVGAALFPPLW